MYDVHRMGQGSKEEKEGTNKIINSTIKKVTFKLISHLQKITE